MCLNPIHPFFFFFFIHPFFKAYLKCHHLHAACLNPVQRKQILLAHTQWSWHTHSTFYFALLVRHVVLSPLSAWRLPSWWQGFCLPTCFNTEEATSSSRNWVRIANSQVLLRPTESKTLGLGPRNPRFNKSSRKRRRLPKSETTGIRVCWINDWMMIESTRAIKMHGMGLPCWPSG